VPQVRPFRALRYEAEAVGDLSLVVSPPYDVISATRQRALLDRHPRNVVRLDLPESEPGEDPDERYRRAARTLATWRSDGTLRKDPRPSLYAYEQTYGTPAGETRTQRGFFGRLGLEALDGATGVRRHERTLAGPREDRYRLLRATGVNTSPVVVLHDDPDRTAATVLEGIAARAADVDIVDEDDVRQRLWIVADDGDERGDVACLVRAASASPVTIADGHHRYETALRYRDERRMSRSCEEDPAFDYILALFLDPGSQALTVLPTHRVVLGVAAAGTDVIVSLTPLFDARPADRAELEGWALGPGGRGRFGLWTRDGGFALEARREVIEPLLTDAGPAGRRLDVTILGAALGRLGIDPDAVESGERVRYSKSAAEAMGWVDAALDGADVAFLLEPTPIPSILEVAAAGEVMPQKSTYFHPKALTGLVINPHEW
jgi:uncharacterized protein (DUF1015 family)